MARTQVAVLVHQGLVAGCLLHRVDVLTLDVLDECLLNGFLLARLPDDAGHLREAQEAARLVAPLPSDDDEPLAVRAYHDGLEQTVLLDAGSKILQGHWIEALARLRRVWVNQP